MNKTHSKTPAEIITASSYIAALLQRIVSEHLLIRVTLGGNSQSALISTVLQVLPRDELFLLDDLFPQPPASNLSPADIVSIQANFEGAELRFRATVESIQEESGLRLWRLAFPESVEYRQARHEHRVEVLPLAIPVRIFVGEGVVLKGQLQDLSPQGIGIRLRRVNGLKRGKAYRCSIDHSDDESVEVAISPQRTDKMGGELPVLLGAELHNMSRQEAPQWQRFVTEIERRLLRKH